MIFQGIIRPLSLVSCLVSLLPGLAFGADDEITPSVKSDADVRVQQDAENPIDWSRPVVSRGFGRSDELQGNNIALRQDYKLGEIAYFLGDYTRALAKWTPLAERGLADAQANLGWLYQAGLGVERDLEQAKQWYEKAAAQGNAVAMNNLGAMYENALGVEKNDVRAYELYRRSAELGYRFAQYNVGILLAEGRGVVRNTPVAIEWLQRAAEQDVSQARERLGQLNPVVE